MANLRSLLAALVLLLMIAIDRPFHSPPIIPIGAAYAAEALPPAHHHSPHDERRKSDDDGSTTGQVVTVVAGYLPDYRDYVNINASSIFLTDIMLFSITPETIFHEYSPHVRGEGGGGGGGGGKCCLSSRHYATMRRARSYGKEERRRRRRRSSTIAANSSSDDENIRILVTIGGGGRSEGFREVVMGNEEYQSRFTRGMVQLCQDEGLDGIDLDFEGIRSHVEWNAYLSYLSTASAALHQHDLIVTVALHPGHYLPKEICTALDRVHVMTYDMIRPNARRLDHHHASMRWAMDALEKFVQNGCPPYKLVMGIPAYGRHERDMGLVRTYSEIVDEMLMNGEDNDKIDEIDELEARIKRIRSVDSWDGYRFDSPDDVRAKVEYVTRNGFGGIFIWELGQDKRISGLAKGGMLLEAAAAAVNNYVGDESHDEL